MIQSLILNESLDILVTGNSKIGLLRDSTNSKINKIESWQNSIINQTKSESLIRKERCEICNSKEDCFEGHHIAGKKHDFRMITTCLSCHKPLSDSQKLWDRRWLLQDQSENLRQAFFLHGLQDILILKSKKTGNSLYETLGNSYTEIISELLK
ncbi:MAG: hypothetical protein IIA83_02205 [Thaumarchaeota archaeon]|nr:hypothetical protein [Nitrososphaerota archaeon]